MTRSLPRLLILAALALISLAAGPFVSSTVATRLLGADGIVFPIGSIDDGEALVRSGSTLAGAAVQASDADLTTWASLTPSAYFQTLVNDASAAVARDTLVHASAGSIACSSPCTPAAGVTVLTVAGTTTVNLPALSTYADGQRLLIVCDSASSCPVTLDPSDSGTCNSGSAGAACSAITVQAHGTVGAIRTGASAWGSVQPGGLATYSAPTLHMYPSGTDMLVAIEVYSGGSWVAVKGPTAVSRTAGSSGNSASISGSAIASASGYATLSDQPLEGDSWREPLDGSGVLGATWTPGAAGWLRIEVTSDQPTVTYYQVYGYAGHPTPGTGPGLRTGWGRGASTKAVHVASDNNTDGGTSPAATATGPAIAYWEWDATDTYTARGWGRVTGGVIEDNPATPPATPTTMAIIAGVLRPALTGGTLSATLDVRVYPSPGTLSWTP